MNLPLIPSNNNAFLVKYYYRVVDEFINHTREWHNEFYYERKNSDTSSAEFKKNPDFIILDQEVGDITLLTSEEKTIQ